MSSVTVTPWLVRRLLVLTAEIVCLYSKGIKSIRRLIIKIIALKPLGNMTKMSDFGFISFLRSDQTKIFVNSVENAYVSKGYVETNFERKIKIFIYYHICHQ